MVQEIRLPPCGGRPGVHPKHNVDIRFTDYHPLDKGPDKGLFGFEAGCLQPSTDFLRKNLELAHEVSDFPLDCVNLPELAFLSFQAGQVLAQCFGPRSKFAFFHKAIDEGIEQPLQCVPGAPFLLLKGGQMLLIPVDLTFHATLVLSL